VQLGFALLGWLRLCQIDPSRQPTLLGYGLPRSARKLQFGCVSLNRKAQNLTARSIVMGLSFQKINEEVFLATDAIVRFDRRAVEFIKEKALSNKRGRARICAHKSNDDSLHEMLIAIRSDSYICPHRHLNKVESFHLVDGRADIVILNERGEMMDVVKLGPDDNFYYRLNAPYYHTLLIHSPILVIHEITNGPFDPAASDFAAFAPAEGASEALEYITSLKRLLSN
jgi:cupin fold WbuC family metalloprotein